MHLRKLALLAAVAAAGAFVACTLNPQPLPPSDDNSSFAPGDASVRHDSGGSFGNDPETPPTEDAAAPAPMIDGDGGMGGEGGEGGDAGSDGGDGGSDADAG